MANEGKRAGKPAVETKSYKLVSGKFVDERGKRHLPGAILQLTASRAAQMTNMVRKVDEPVYVAPPPADHYADFVAVIDLMLKRDPDKTNETWWLKNGKPSLDALNDLLEDGIDLNSKQRNDYWDRFNGKE